MCGACTPQTPLRNVLVYTRRQGLGREAIHRMKYERARSGIDELAALTAGLFATNSEDVLLTHIPTATARVRQRGYGHARLLARSAARYTGLEHALLARPGQLQTTFRRCTRHQSAGAT